MFKVALLVPIELRHNGRKSTIQKIRGFDPPVRFSRDFRTGDLAV